MCADQHVQRSDGVTLALQESPDRPIISGRRLIERSYFESADKSVQRHFILLRGVALGNTKGKFSERDGGDAHITRRITL